MSKSISVLMIEDREEDAFLNIRCLKRAGYTFSSRRVENREGMEAALQEGGWDLILSDYNLPGYSIHEALEQYRAHNLKIPFIVISGFIGEEKAAELIRDGVHDYILKSNMTRFPIVVERELKQFAIQQDIAKINTALSISEKQYHSYVENAPDAVFLTDGRGTYLEVNRATCMITGYKETELLKLSVLDMLTLESREDARLDFRNMFSTGSLSGDYYIKNKQGELVCVTVDGIKLSDSRFLFFTKDITQRKKAELEAMKAREEMQKLNQYLMDARENERAIISLEIHDELGQALTALKIDLGFIARNLDNKDACISKLEKMADMTSNTIKVVQRIASELRPGLLDDLGLASAIEWYCGEFESRTGITCVLNLQEIPELDPRINLTLFRIQQEAMVNVARHSRATLVRITLRTVEKGTTLIIDDNGIGITEKQTLCSTSLGVLGMRERARHFSGTVEFIGKNKRGTRVVVFIPAKVESKTNGLL